MDYRKILAETRGCDLLPLKCNYWLKEIITMLLEQLVKSLMKGFPNEQQLAKSEY